MRSAYVFRRPVANAYLVRERDRRRLRELLWVLLVALPLVATVLGAVWLHLEALQAGYRIHRLERELETLSDQERRLELEEGFLIRPGRVEREARERLDMRYPAPEQLVFPEAEE